MSNQDPLTGRFLKGCKPGPGRKSGSPRRDLTNEFIHALHADFKKHGRKAIVQMRLERPDKYAQIIAALAPKQAEEKVQNTFESYTDEQLHAIASGILAEQERRRAGGDIGEDTGREGATVN